MSYRIIHGPRSVARLEGLPAALVPGADAAFLRLGASPTSVSSRVASPPFPPVGQLYHFTLPRDPGRAWFFTAVFRCSQDVTALHVITVNWRDVAAGDPY